jgi:hypothetical protein
MPKPNLALSTVAAAAEMDRRRSPRRKMPFGRTAIFEVGEQAHVVALVDLSVSGAYLAIRSAVPKNSSLRLRLRLPKGGEVALHCELVRETGDDPANGRRAGVGVRFVRLDDRTRSRLEAFVAERGSPFGR